MVEPAWVRRATRLPELSLARPSVQSVSILATSARGVHRDLKHHKHDSSVSWSDPASSYMSAPGMNFLFMGVSRVTGRMPRTQVSPGSPEPSLARLFTSWWTAALAIP